MTKSKQLASQVSDAAERDEPIREMKISRRNLLSTGSTLLNLAISGNPFGGFLKGKYYFLVGDSASGKTFLSMTCLAEATTNRQFKDYRFIYDNIEDGMLIDIEELFNEAVGDRMEPPKLAPDGQAVYSSTIEEFYYNVEDAIQEGVPFIYVLDSMDALFSDSSEKKFGLQKKAHDKVQRKAMGAEKEEEDGDSAKVAGSYGDGKAKVNSSNLRKVLQGLRNTGSILIILSQTRDNIGSRYGGKTRSGGHALRFYATAEIWSSIDELLFKQINGRKRQIGVRVELRVKKNRQTGKLFSVTTDIFPSYGIDDVGACVDYLVEEKWWAVQKQSIVAREFGLTATREKLISFIEEQEEGARLRAIVGQCWKEIDQACSLQRKKKYDN